MKFLPTRTLLLLVFLCVTQCRVDSDCLDKDFSCSALLTYFLFVLRKPFVASGPADALHTAYVSADGRLRVWGDGANGKLGYNNVSAVGNSQDTSILRAGYVNLGDTAISIAAGDQHTCAVLSSGNVRCWGLGANGRLGHSNTSTIGDSPSTSIVNTGDIPLGGTAVQVTAGYAFACALLTTGKVRCWGGGSSGQLGYSSTANVGDTPATSILNAGDVPVGGNVTQISAGLNHVCALLVGGTVRCWGAGTNGQLGYNGTANVGDSSGSAIMVAGDVPLGGTAVFIGAGRIHTCAVLTTGAVRCWGDGANGKLGYNATAAVGNSGPTSIINTGDVPLGGLATQVVGGDSMTCALLTTGAVRCWGSGTFGEMGNNNTANVGDTAARSIINSGDIPMGFRATQITVGSGHACAVLETGNTRCWGGGGVWGRLGYNSTASVGDSEQSSILRAGDVPVPP